VDLQELWNRGSIVPEPDSNPARGRGFRGDAIVLAVFGAGVAFWFWLASGENAPAPVARRNVLADQFVGDAACASCHPGESASHARSGHSRTLRPAALADAARLFDGRPIQDPEHSAEWRLSRRDRVATADRVVDGQVKKFIIDYAFGSGRHATTFVSLTDRTPARPAALEHRLTFFAYRDAMDVTPGQTRDTTVDPHELSPEGRTLGPEKTLECFGCHATILRETGVNELDPATMIPNITCERCHGPARAHVEATRQGRKGPAMPFGMGKSSADLQMRHCGFCHRHPEMAPPGEIHPDNPGLARFQPVGLTQSACYKKTPGGVSCTACHDPHARASTDAAGYEEACLSCHRAPSRTPCPVNPATGCLPCHMPGRDSGQGILFHDHWIRKPDARARPSEAAHPRDRQPAPPQP
jgi:hypothetical protein